ncbi:MAG: hypothetical protein KDJ31_14545 [Candidatus Competibacteraceae bacterium]|nr:hypothetical protein [Candidatus Competibacteraceae bacterium]MCB1820323.1 hypothetical protein [Candidatus Competibacteraceae bacterium]HRY15427.1 hypothetical protein [Candidatus Competibacteraceae bacterium]
MPVERDEKGRWLKGHSGNQNGMPKRLAEIRTLAREYTKEAIETLVNLMRDETKEASCRVRAAQELLDRAWGKPTQPLDHQGEAFSLVLNLGGK